MFRSVVFLALACVAVLAQREPELKYRYQASVETGVQNELSRQAYSQSRIDMNVIFRWNKNGISTVKFEDPQTGEFNTVGGWGVPHNVQMTSRRELSSTVRAHLRRPNWVVMEVPEQQKHWVTEIQKPVVQLFKTANFLNQWALNNSEKLKEGMRVEEFTKRETTYAGVCDVLYTVTPVDQRPAPGREMHLSVKTAILFNTCKNTPSFVKSSHGNFSGITSDQFKTTQTRSVFAEYLFTSTLEGIRLDEVRQFGEQTFRPFGQETGMIKMSTNQTMKLELSRHSSTAMEMEGKTKLITSWMYQFVSPASPLSKHTPAIYPPRPSAVPWVIYENKTQDALIYPEYAILGEDFETQTAKIGKVRWLVKRAAQFLLNPVDDWKYRYEGTTDGRATELLNLASKIIRSVKYTPLKQLFEEIRKQKDSGPEQKATWDHLLYTTMSSGSAAFAKILREYAQSQTLDPYTISNLVAWHSPGAIDTEGMADLMEIVKMMSSNKFSFYDKSLGYLNFARLAHRLCVDPQSRRYAVPFDYLGDKVCDEKFVDDGIVGHLTEKFRGTGKTSEKLLYIEALASLGASRAVSFVQNVVSDRNQPWAVRIAGMHAMSKFATNKTLTEKMITTLMPISLDTEETYEIREAAFIGIIFNRPNATILEQFAQRTYAEPSERMVSLITSAYISLAESDYPSYRQQNNAVRNLIPIMKMIDPSMSNSAFFLRNEYVPRFGIGVKASIAWLDKYMSHTSTRQQMYFSASGDFGGIQLPLLEMFTLRHGEDGSLIKRVQSRLPVNPRSSVHRKIQEDIEMYAGDLGVNLQEGTSEVTSYYSWQGTNFMTSFKVDLINTIKQLMENMPDGPVKTLHSSKFFNIFDIVSVLPSPVGLPSITEMTAPNTVTVSGTLDKQTSGPVREFAFDGVGKSVYKTQTFISVLLPWSKQRSTAGIDAEFTFSFPGKLAFEFGVSRGSMKVDRVVYKPKFSGRRSLLYIRSAPLSTLRPIGPDSDITKAQNLVRLNGVYSDGPSGQPKFTGYRKTIPFSQRLFGLDAAFEYEGDSPFPSNHTLLGDWIRNPGQLVTFITTPTGRNLRSAVKLNPSNSETKEISLSTTFDYGYVEGRPSSSRHSMSVAELKEKLRTESPKQVMKSLGERQLGDFNIILEANLTGPSRPREYYLGVQGLNITENNSDKFKQMLHASISRAGIPGDQGFVTMGANAILEEERKASRQASQSQLHTEGSLQVFYGNGRKAQEIGQGSLQLFLNSDDRQVLQSSGVESNEVSPPNGRPSWVQNAFYDHIKFNFKWTKEQPQCMRNGLRQVQDIAGGMVYPYVATDHTAQNSLGGNDYTVEVKRCPVSDTIRAWARGQSHTSLVEDFPVSQLFDWMSPFLGPRVLYKRHLTEPPRKW